MTAELSCPGQGVYDPQVIDTTSASWNDAAVQRISIPSQSAAAGIISIVLGSAGVVVDRMWSFPATTASPAEITAFVTDRRVALAVAMVLTAAAVGLWLVFAAGVWSALRRATGDRHDPGLAVFAWATTAFVTLLLAGFTAFGVLIARPAATRHAGLLYDLTFGLLAMSGIPTALALAAYAALASRSRAFPSITIQLALIAALAHLGLLASFIVERGFFSLEGAVIIAIPGTLFLWIFVMSVDGLRRADRWPPAVGPSESS